MNTNDQSKNPVDEHLTPVGDKENLLQPLDGKESEICYNSRIQGNREVINNLRRSNGKVVSDEGWQRLGNHEILRTSDGITHNVPRTSQYDEPRLEGDELREIIKFRVRQARREAEYKQRHMADFFGVKLGTYAKWENTPAGMMPLHNVSLFCELVNLSPQDLFYPYLRETELRMLRLGF